MKTYTFTNTITYKQTTLDAHEVSVTNNGELLFLIDNKIIYAISPGYWFDVLENSTELDKDDNS